MSESKQLNLLELRNMIDFKFPLGAPFRFVTLSGGDLNNYELVVSCPPAINLSIENDVEKNTATLIYDVPMEYKDTGSWRTLYIPHQTQSFEIKPK